MTKSMETDLIDFTAYKTIRFPWSVKYGGQNQTDFHDFGG